MQRSYALARLSAAIDTLATHPGAVKDRLKAAALEVFLVPRAALPDWQNIDEDLGWIQRELTKRGDSCPAPGNVSATLRGMRNKTAVAIAERIVNVHAKLKAYEQMQESAPC